jgi:hypothetical protein
MSLGPVFSFFSPPALLVFQSFTSGIVVDVDIFLIPLAHFANYRPMSYVQLDGDAWDGL